MRAIVTGANGFIGTQLRATLAGRGYDVVPIVRADFADSRFEHAVDGADVVIHAAGATRAPTREGLRASNVELTRRVVAAAMQARAKRLVFISSQAAAGPAASLDRPVTEDDQPAPIEAYGESKRDAEVIVRESGLPAVIVRPAAVYGPHDRDFRAMFSLARRGMAIHPGNRDQWISIIHVRDCADAIALAASTPAAEGRTYFLANDEPVQWASLFEIARSASAARPRLDVDIPLPLVQLGAKGGDILARLTGHASLLTSEKVALGRPSFWVCSNARAKRELGFTPRVPLATGIAETYRWYLENGGL
jgi:nucleoside-diphosphate-sugar epimerase